MCADCLIVAFFLFLFRVARPGFPGLKKNFFIFEHLLRHFLPRLHAHFEAQMIITSAYATKVLH